MTLRSMKLLDNGAQTSFARSGLDAVRARLQGQGTERVSGRWSSYICVATM